MTSPSALRPSNPESRARRAAGVGARAWPTSTTGTDRVIVAWTEAEIGDSDIGRMADGLIAEIAGRPRPSVASAKPNPVAVDPQIAAFALVAMIERLNYYAMTRQVRVEREGR